MSVPVCRFNCHAEDIRETKVNCSVLLLKVDLLALRRRIREEYQVDVHLYYAGSLAPANIDDASQGRTRTTAYVRISHQIYNNNDEYIKLRDVVNDIARKS